MALQEQDRPETAAARGVSPDQQAAVEERIKTALPDLRVWVPIAPAAIPDGVGEHLKKGESLVGDAFSGPVGAADAATLVLVEVAGGPSRLAGFLLVPAETGADARRVDLPAFDRSQLHQLEWVSFLNADDDGAWEVVVQSTHMTGAGPEGAQPYAVVAVIDWDGKAATRLEAAEKALEGVVSPDEARVRLAKERFEAGRKAGRFAGPCREVTADLVTTYAYDAYGRLVREATASEVRTHRYDAVGNLVETETAYTDGAPVMSTYTVDARGLVVVSRQIVSNGDEPPQLVAVVTTYDAGGRVVKEASIDADSVHFVTYAWEGQRLVKSDHDYPDVEEFCAPTPPTKHEEDAQGRTIREEFRETPGLCEGERDETWRYDPAGNLIEHRVKDLDGGAETLTLYDYACWTNPAP